MISPNRKTITSAQLRAARALVRWSADDLAREAGIGVATVRRAEALEGPVAMIPANMAAVVRALEAAGVIFLDDGEVTTGGPGVRLKGTP